MNKAAQQGVWKRTIRRMLKAGVYCGLGYISLILLGLIPVNNSFRESQNGVRIFVVSNAVHADLILPVEHEQVDWREEFAGAQFRGDVSNQTHVAIGWGDRGFFLETETWEDLKFSVAANALLLPSSSCMHVNFTRPSYYPTAKAVFISERQYADLVAFVQASFDEAPQERYRQIEGYAYANTDAFFAAHGRYHLLNTCNSWVGRALKTAGVRVPWFSPLPGTPAMYLKDAAQAESSSAESN